MASPDDHWAEMAERLRRGDRLAYVALTRLIVVKLNGLRAYDFQSEWSDLIHEVLMDLIEKVRAGGIRDRSTVKGLVAQMTRNKFMDRLRRHYRRDDDEILPWDEMSRVLESTEAGVESRSIASLDLNLALSALDEKERLTVIAIHSRGMTYEEAAEATGIPLGSTKRYLRQALNKLRQNLENSQPE